MAGAAAHSRTRIPAPGPPGHARAVGGRRACGPTRSGPRRRPATRRLDPLSAPADCALPELVRLTACRGLIETCFQQCKQHLGMGHYEVRSWTGWHHHMTLCLLAHFFLVQQQVRLKKKLRP